MQGAAARRAVAKVVEPTENTSGAASAGERAVRKLQSHSDPTLCTRCGRSWDFTSVEDFEVWRCMGCGYEVRERPSEWAREQLAARFGGSPRLADMD